MGVKFPYNLVRSKRKRVAIYIKDGAVTVRAPLKADIKKIEEFINSKQHWIETKLSAYSARKDRCSEIFECKRFPFLGEDLTVVSTRNKSVKIKDGSIFIPDEYFDNGQVCKSDKLERALRSAYRRSAQIYLKQRMDEIAAKTKLKYTRFALTNATTKWGSCDSENGIRLSWRLMLLDKSVVDYVIVHELAHTVEHNHSKNFWNLVHTILPQYKEKIKCLKEAGVIIKIW